MRNTKKNNGVVSKREPIPYTGIRPYITLFDMMPLVYEELPLEYWKRDTITLGVTTEHVPFVAELWKDEDVERLTIVIPVLHVGTWDLDVLKKKYKKDELFKSEGYTVEMKCLLADGIVDEEDEESMLMVTAYTEYLIKKGLITFVNDYEGVCLSYGRDLIGNKVAVITIDMVIDGTIYAKTDLPVRFPRSMFE